MQSQKLITIACHHKEDIWVANIYIGVDKKGWIYFLSPKDTKHSQILFKNPGVAFSFAWFDPINHKDRKGIQGLGLCRIAKSTMEITTGIKLLYKNFPDLKDILNPKWITTNIWGSRIWVLKPSYIKYWDDEIYGENKTNEFIFE
jgi:uncharacterized protein YhbP (UPF0306 family)